MFHLIDCIFTRLVASSLLTQLLDLDFTVRRFLDGKSAFCLVRFSFETEYDKSLRFFKGGSILEF